MSFDCEPNVSKIFDTTNESPHHLENFRSNTPPPKLLKEIRENELVMKDSKGKLENSSIFSSFESILQASADGNCPNYETDFVKEKEVLKDLVMKTTEKHSKKNQKINFNETQMKPKATKNKMHNFLFLLSTILIVKDFIGKLRNLSFLRSPSKLNKSHFNLIGDKSYIKEEFSNFSFEYLHLKFGENFLILDPSKNFSIFLDCTSLLSLSYYFLMIPLHFTYKSFALNSTKVKIDSIAFYFLVFDLLRTLNTAFYLKGKLVYSRWKIAVHYLKQDFLFDFISLAPAFLLILDIYKNHDQFFLILFYLKIMNFKEIITRLEQLLLTNRKFNNALSLIKLIVWIIFFTHSFACIWNGVGLIGDKYFETTWLKENSLDDSDPIEQYLFSYYFICVTMNTVGFGDISPKNKFEVGFCIVFIFLACGIFAYSINSIGIILTNISKQQDEYRKDLNTINDFMKKKKISFDLRMRVRKYLEYIQAEKKLHEEEETGKTIDKLSDSLREELLLEANGSILKRINFFSFNFSEETLRKTMMIMKEQKFIPGDVIFEKGDYQESKLYIIKTGEVELLCGNSSHLKTVHTCKKGDTFGEVGFFSGQERTFSARSLDFTTTLAIDQAEFLSIINKVNKDFEKFNEIKEKLILYKDISPLHLRCFCCHDSNHRIENCPILHYCPKKKIIIDKFLFNYLQERRSSQRKRMSKIHNSLIKKRRNSKIAKQLQDDLEDLKRCSSSLESESEENEYDKEINCDFSETVAKWENNNITNTGESLKSSKTRKSRSSSVSRIETKTRMDYEDVNEKSGTEFQIANSEESEFKRLYLCRNSIATRTKPIQNKFFDLIDFDKLGFFSNYFPNNDVEVILEKIELKRVNYLKKLYSKKGASFYYVSSRSRNFASIHRINEVFVQDGSIKINKKTMGNFNEDRRKGYVRTHTKRLNLKKSFFKRVERSPEEIKKYFRAKLRNNRNFLKKLLTQTLKKLRICIKKKNILNE